VGPGRAGNADNFGCGDGSGLGRRKNQKEANALLAEEKQRRFRKGETDMNPSPHAPEALCDCRQPKTECSGAVCDKAICPLCEAVICKVCDRAYCKQCASYLVDPDGAGCETCMIASENLRMETNDAQ